MTKSQSLERGLDVMELLNASARPLGTREIARQLDLSPAIVQRLLNTLAERHYIRQNAETKRYGIGYQVLNLGSSLQGKDALLVESRKELEALTKEMRLDTYLAVMQDKQAIYLLSIQGEGPVTVRGEPGQAMPLHSTAIGKVLLAALSDEEALRLLTPGPLRAVTEKTITDPYLLVSSLAKMREQGYAFVVDENILGISSVGAPVRDSSGQVKAAISASFSRHFSPDIRIEEVADLVMRAARRIGRNIGG